MKLDHQIYVLLLLLGTVVSRGADTNASPKEKWYDVQGIGGTIYEQKKVILLPTEAALSIFTREFPHIKSTWKEELKSPIEAAPKSWPAPTNGFVPYQGEALTPRAVVTQFSEQQIEVMIQRPIGYHRWHTYAECLGTFRIARDSRVDELFGMTNLVLHYATPYKGIGYGSSQEAVIKALGEPDAYESYQPLGYFRYSYFKDDIVIQFQNFVVKWIKRGVPAELREEVKQGGKHKTRG